MINNLKFIFSMLIFGSIGIFVKFIDIPSAQIVQYRTLIGSLCLLAYFIVARKKIDFKAIGKNIIPLIISGAAIGSSWMFLFMAYKGTTVGMATIVYYFAPILVFFLAPIIFKEKTKPMQFVGIAFAVAGMILVNILEFRTSEFSSAIVYAMLSALLYAVIMITNKFIKNIDDIQSTFVQLLVASLVMTSYCFVTTGEIIRPISGKNLWLILLVGILHTGFAMSIYISSLQKLSQQNASIFSYVDPASALIFAFAILGESLSWYQALGAVLIFGGALFAQLGKNPFKHKAQQNK